MPTNNKCHQPDTIKVYTMRVSELFYWEIDSSFLRYKNKIILMNLLGIGSVQDLMRHHPSQFICVLYS